MAVSFALLLFQEGVIAQAMGGVSGVVKAAPDKPIPGALVTLTLSRAARIYATTTTSSTGTFIFTATSAGLYDLKIEAPGFGIWISQGIQVSPAIETSLPPIWMVPGSVPQGAAPPDSGQFLQSTSTSAQSALDSQQANSLPALRGDLQLLVDLFPGVQENGRAAAVYGESPSTINIALGGVNIERSFVNTKTVDSVSLPLHIDQIEEATLVTGGILGCGCAQVILTTPMGSNQLHGLGYWLAIPNATTAQSWSNNSARTPSTTRFNRLGASAGGALKNNRLFLFANYEAGLDGSAITRTGEVPTTPIVSQDSLVNKVLALMPVSGTGLYRGVQQNGSLQNLGLVRLDYLASPRHVFGLTLSGSHGITDDPGDSSVFGSKPDTTISLSSGFYSAFWRSALTPSLTNEARAGASLPAMDFLNSLRSQFGFIAVLNDPNVPVSQPMTGMDPEGRRDYVYSYQDTLNWVKGKHTFQFGGWFQLFRLDSFGFNNGLLDSVTLPRFTVNNLVAGTVSEEEQRFTIAPGSLAYSAGAAPRSRLSANMTSPYFLHTWRFTPSIAITMGVRYDYLSPAEEGTGTAIMPVISGSEPAQYLYNQNLPFTVFSPQRPLYVRDRDNTSPYGGIVWKPFSRVPLVVRGNGNNTYTPAELLPNMSIYALRNPFQSFNVSTALNNISLSQAPAVPVPVLPPNLTLQSLLNFANQYGQSPGPVLAIDPQLRTPNIHYWSLGVETHAAGFDWRVRYLENGLEEGPRSVDRNTVMLPPQYLAAFVHAQSQLESTGTTSGFPLIPGAGICSNFSVQACQPDLYAISLIQTGQAGELASWLMAQGYHPDTSAAGYYLLGNPFAPGGIDLLSKLGDSRYDGLEVTAVRRFAATFGMMLNYVFSKVRSNLDDYQLGAIDPLLDLHNPSLEWAPAPFDQRQVLKLTWTWEPRFFRGSPTSWFRSAIVNWTMSGFVLAQSGAPFSLLSGGYVTGPDGQVSEVTGLGTFGSAADSGQNPVTTALTGPEIQKFLGIRESPGGVVSYVSAPAGAFQEPAAGTLGNLPRRMFTGPGATDFNLSLRKSLIVTERTRLDFRADAINLANKVNWLVGDQTFLGNQGQSAIFNNNVSQWNTPREMQFQVRLFF